MLQIMNIYLKNSNTAHFMELGDIVSWIPDYAVIKNIPVSLWLGVVVQLEAGDRPGQTKVYWYMNKENYHKVDWTPTTHLRLISKV